MLLWRETHRPHPPDVSSTSPLATMLLWRETHRPHPPDVSSPSPLATMLLWRETYKGGQKIVVGGSIVSLEDESKQDDKCRYQRTKCKDRAVCVCVCVGGKRGRRICGRDESVRGDMYTPSLLHSHSDTRTHTHVVCTNPFTWGTKRHTHAPCLHKPLHLGYKETQDRDSHSQ